MSTTYQGVNYAKTQASPVSLIDEGQLLGDGMYILDQFILTADLVANDQILVGGLIPEGAIVLDAVLSSGALGGSAAVNFGWLASASVPSGAQSGQAADLTAFFSGLPVSSATVAKAHGSTYEGDFYTQAPLTGAVQPVITCSVASSGATGKEIFVEIRIAKIGG